MDLIIESSEEVSGKVEPSPSKFYTQFASVISLLTDGKNVINSPLLVDDTRELVKAIETMGGTSKRSKKKWSIWGTGKFPKPSGQYVDSRKSLMSMSLLTSLSALASRIMVVTGNKQVRSRYVPSLIDSLGKIGVDVHSTKSDETPPLVIFESNLEGGKFNLDKDMDPRFLPAFLLLTPYPEEGVELELDPVFDNFITDMALDLMEKSGIGFEKEEDVLKIENSDYETFEVTPPLDLFSTLPYVIGAVITGSELEISKLDKSVNFEDFVSLLDRVGIDFEKEENSMRILENQELEDGEYSLSDFPQVLPFLAVLGCFSKGKTRIRDAERARNMKSDRISAMCMGLEKMGCSVEEKEDGLVIDGSAELEGVEVDGQKDDAIVAALGTAAIIAEGKTVVKNRAETLRESYPHFVSTFKDLGAEIGYGS